jgi:hypothetical protein
MKINSIINRRDIFVNFDESQLICFLKYTFISSFLGLFCQKNEKSEGPQSQAGCSGEKKGKIKKITLDSSRWIK